ncbi:hypothetical protein PUN4_600128 [Paraburkholderia unamae]|nr:hypothetical protein PUN4_600128 [Paraburkholderia unamae]
MCGAFVRMLDDASGRRRRLLHEDAVRPLQAHIATFGRRGIYNHRRGLRERIAAVCRSIK